MYIFLIALLITLIVSNQHFRTFTVAGLTAYTTCKVVINTKTKTRFASWVLPVGIIPSVGSGHGYAPLQSDKNRIKVNWSIKTTITKTKLTPWLTEPRS